MSFKPYKESLLSRIYGATLLGLLYICVFGCAAIMVISTVDAIGIHL